MIYVYPIIIQWFKKLWSTLGLKQAEAASIDHNQKPPMLKLRSTKKNTSAVYGKHQKRSILTDFVDED